MQRLWKVCAIILPLIFPASASAGEIEELKKTWDDFSMETGIGFGSHTYYTGPRSRPKSVTTITIDLTFGEGGFQFGTPTQTWHGGGGNWDSDFLQAFEDYRQTIE